jgi:hypothetical protein
LSVFFGYLSALPQSVKVATFQGWNVARIRTIKPAFFSDEALLECSHSARLLFIGLWVFGDDMGRSVFSPRAIQNYIFPNDITATIPHIVGWVQELEKADVIERYEVDGAQYLRVLGFLRHQYVNIPSHSNLPPGPREHGPICRCAPCLKKSKVKTVSKRANVFHMKQGQLPGTAAIAEPCQITATDEPEVLPPVQDSAGESLEASGHDFEGIVMGDGLEGKDRKTRRRDTELFAVHMLEALGLSTGVVLVDEVIEAIRRKALAEHLTLESAGNAVFGPAALLVQNGEPPESWPQYFRGIGA